MATKEQIFGILSGASGPISRAELEEKVGESYRKFQTQLDRWMKQELVEDTGDKHYVLTDKGREDALKGEFQEIDDEIDKEPAFARAQPEKPPQSEQADKEPGLAGADEPTQESLATTEYQQFLKLGKTTGVIPLSLIKMTADHVWTGDFRDIKWVAQAMVEMDIRQDLRGRWLNAWRGKMHKALPGDLPAEFFPEGKKGTEKTEGAGKRDYILNEYDTPTYAGEGLGDLDYKDALELSKIRAGRGKGDGRAATAGSMADDVTKIFSAFKEVMGDRAAGKTYLVKPGVEGYQVEELDPNKPMLIPQTQAAKPGPSYLLDSDGSMKELQPGQPTVIIKEAPKQISQASHYLINQSTGEMKEVAPGQPVIIIRESTPAPQSTPIQVRDKDGNPMTLDLGTFIKLEEHRDKQRRDEESHETKMEIAKGFKDLLNKAGKALSHMVEEEK